MNLNFKLYLQFFISEFEIFVFRYQFLFFFKYLFLREKTLLFYNLEFIFLLHLFAFNSMFYIGTNLHISNKLLIESSVMYSKQCGKVGY